MGVEKLYKTIIFVGLLTVLAMFSFFTFVKIWGERLIVKDWYRQEFVSSGEMTISEFGKSNQLKNPI